ncbi:hypothetical protein RRF57_003789 [Xylaria bambusicola]|uniref:Uncharacterized protein n=1 Tax=Xylaria bambusicola TaxID=326684 RepID=A0AAN7UFP4_9PEZI
MSLARTRPSLAMGVMVLGGAWRSEEAASLAVFLLSASLFLAEVELWRLGVEELWLRDRRSPLIRRSTRRSRGGVLAPDDRRLRMLRALCTLWLPGLSVRNLASSGVRSREMPVFDVDRRAALSICGVDSRLTSCMPVLSETLLVVWCCGVCRCNAALASLEDVSS